MTTVQTQKNLKRNAPCHCGSGKKYKKCCMLKEKKAMDEGKIITGQNAPLKNEFRNKVRDPYAGIPEVELVRRDQSVLLKELRLRKYITEMNNASIAMVIEKVKELCSELMSLPKSPYREVCIANAGKMLENNQNVLQANKFPIETEITLLALEEVFADIEEVKKLAKPFGSMIKAPETKPEDAAEDAEAEDELNIPPEPKEDSDDDEDDPNEVI